MNNIFVLIMCLGLGLVTMHMPGQAFDILITGSTKAINLSLKLLAIYCVWLSILEIVERSKLHKIMAKLLHPIIKALFGNVGHAEDYIATNITANIFGMGNACVPSGIKAMQKLDNHSKYITASMAMLFILNVTSLELIPSTVIGLRISMGSMHPNNIILPTLIATTASTLTGIIFTKLFAKKFKGGK